MKRLFEIVTDHIGESYVRSYAWADSEEHAKRMFRESFRDIELMHVRPLFWRDAGAFVTNPSDSGFEVSQELEAILAIQPSQPAANSEQSEIEAAAERVRRWCECCTRGDYDDHEYHQDAPLQQADESVLIDWAVARLAADRAEREERERPIDEAWLLSAGAKKTLSCLSPNVELFSFSAYGPTTIELSFCPGGSWYVLLIQDDDVVTLRNAVYRGQLLDLLAALGVERKGGDMTEWPKDVRVREVLS